MPIKQALLLFLFTVSVYAQTPSIDTYIQSLTNTTAGIIASVGGTAQPKINASAQHLYANANFIDSGRAAGCDPSIDGSCPTNSLPTLTGFVDAIAHAGANSMDINMDMEPLICSAQYVTAGGTIPCGADSWRLATLVNLDGMMAHAKAIGMKVRFAPTPTANLVALCGLTSSSTATDLNTCFNPLYVAAAARWPELDSFTVFHEAIGAWGSALPMAMTLALVRTFITSSAAAVKAQNPSTLVGAAAETMFASDVAYYNNWITNDATMGLDFYAIDLYAPTWDINIYRYTALVNGAAMAASSLGLGKPVRINEFNRPPWVSTGASPVDDNALMGAGNCFWSPYDENFMVAIFAWAEAHGISSISRFDSPIFCWCTTDASNDKIQSGTYTHQVISRFAQTSQIGQSYQSLAAGHTVAAQGGTITGAVMLGH